MYGYEIVSKSKIIYFCCRIPRGMRGLKSDFLRRNFLCRKSHPARDAWIEIFATVYTNSDLYVASREGCVDWNLSEPFRKPLMRVASREGCVDWNLCIIRQRSGTCQSHPARDAWIEMSVLTDNDCYGTGRIPRGMRGLKYPQPIKMVCNRFSRIPRGMRGLKSYLVIHAVFLASRIPRGMRGLKLLQAKKRGIKSKSHPARDAWIEIK